MQQHDRHRISPRPFVAHMHLHALQSHKARGRLGPARLKFVHRRVRRPGDERPYRNEKHETAKEQPEGAQEKFHDEGCVEELGFCLCADANPRSLTAGREFMAMLEGSANAIILIAIRALFKRTTGLFE